MKNLLENNYGSYIVLEIDGEKLLLQNGTWGNYIVDDNDNILKIEKRIESRTIGKTIMGRVLIDGKSQIVEKACTLKVIAQDLQFNLPHGTIIGSKYIRFGKYENSDKGWRRSAKLTKYGKVAFNQK